MHPGRSEQVRVAGMGEEHPDRRNILCKGPVVRETKGVRGTDRRPVWLEGREQIGWEVGNKRKELELALHGFLS